MKAEKGRGKFFFFSKLQKVHRPNARAQKLTFISLPHFLNSFFIFQNLFSLLLNQNFQYDVFSWIPHLKYPTLDLYLNVTPMRFKRMWSCPLHVDTSNQPKTFWSCREKNHLRRKQQLVLITSLPFGVD